MSGQSRVSAISGAQVQSLVYKLKDCQVLLELYFGEIPVDDLSGTNTACHHDMKMKITGKHASQHSSLISHLRRCTPFDKRFCFIEFGCGIGRLSEQLQEETEAVHSHLLIDRQTFKGTKLRDKAMQKRLALVPSNYCTSCVSSPISRVTADIANITLDKCLEECFGQNRVVPVAISKHLCGKAFDIIVEYNQSVSSIDMSAPVMPICMAPCCHSICEWIDCFYQPFFSSLGFTEEDYSAIVILSQWGTLGRNEEVRAKEYLTDASHGPTLYSLQKPSVEQIKRRCTGKIILTRDVLDTLNRAEDTLRAADRDGRRELFTCNAIIGESVEEENWLLQLSGEEFEACLSKDNKKRLGIACKELIDIGRGVGLIAAGYSQVELVRYTHSSVENLLICAK